MGQPNRMRSSIRIQDQADVDPSLGGKRPGLAVEWKALVVKAVFQRAAAPSTTCDLSVRVARSRGPSGWRDLRLTIGTRVKEAFASVTAYGWRLCGVRHAGFLSSFEIRVRDLGCGSTRADDTLNGTTRFALGRR
jgi:hypothetical protein